MKIATFNINGIKARALALPAWLDSAQPDVVLLQEIKSVDAGFPREIFEERGYNVENITIVTCNVSDDKGALDVVKDNDLVMTVEM